MRPGLAWLDTGTPESLIQAANFVEIIESRQGTKIGCIEEVAYRMGFITAAQVEQLAQKLPNDYGRYLKDLDPGGRFVLRRGLTDEASRAIRRRFSAGSGLGRDPIIVRRGRPGPA